MTTAMAISWRPAGFSFGLRLLALLLAPLLGVGVLAFQRIETERDASSAARHVFDDARLQQRAAAVYGPAQLEQIALQGLAAIDALGVGRDDVVAITGVDFESVYGDNAVKLDASLDVLVERHGSVPAGPDSTLGEGLSFVRGALEVQRGASSEFRATETDVSAVFLQLDETIAAALANGSNDPSAGANGLIVEDQLQLTALSDVLSAAGDRGAAMLDGLLDRTAETMSEIESSSNRLEYAIERYRAVVGDDERFDSVLESLQPIPGELLEGPTGGSIAEVFDIGYIRTAAEVFIAQLSFLETLEAYSNEFHESVVDELASDSLSADEAATNTTVFAALIAVVSLAILLLLAWSTLRPLRRLTRRASDISDGSFDVEPLPERGPHDVRVLTNTMNSMASTLRNVDREIAGLATGESGVRDRDLPGTIGVSITQSFDRLEQMTARLHESEQLASSIVEQAADAIWTIDAHGLIASANGASVELTGVPADEQVGEPLKVFLPRTSGEVDVRNASGETARLLVSCSEITGGEAPLTTVIAHDISERLRFEERLAYQAHHDALTGLPNRFAVLEALGATSGGALAVLFVDLDGFKSVNDTRGHLIGDRVLTDVGARLLADVRPGDFVGRLGGDEFVVIMHDISQPADAISFGYRLIRAIEKPYRDDDHLFALSASVGIATFPRGLAAEDCDALGAIRRADSAVYAAKAKGRGRVEAFDEGLQTRIVDEAEIELALRSAVRNNELELHFQPVFDTVLNRFTSAEALVRWNRPGHGMISPGQFIPVAERSSLIDEVGRWVLTAACTTLARWADDQDLRETRIAVNVAGSHLLDGDLVADLDAALLLSGADPSRLEFELTETQLMADHERAAATLKTIRSRGIKVAIDDFGTGYSSMAYLRQLPIDTLKIDRSFISPIGETTDDGAATDTTVVDALLTIGHALGLSVVAEGVETQTQLEYVTAHGADRIQGFLLARPTPVGEAETLLRSASHVVNR